MYPSRKPIPRIFAVAVSTVLLYGACAKPNQYVESPGSYSPQADASHPQSSDASPAESSADGVPPQYPEEPTPRASEQVDVAHINADAGSNQADIPSQSTPDGHGSPTGHHPECSPNPPPADYGLICGCEKAGTIGCDGNCTASDDNCVPSGYWHSITSELTGVDMWLDTYASDADNELFLNAPGFSGGLWDVIRLAGGDFRLRNMFLPTKSLTVSSQGKLTMAPTNDSAEQRWRIRGAGPGFFRITSAAHGSTLSLDVDKAQPTPVPSLRPSRNHLGQRWRILKVGASP